MSQVPPQPKMPAPAAVPAPADSRPSPDSPPDGTPAAAGDRRPAQPPGEIGGPTGPEPTRYGDWESKGRCSDF